MRKIMLVALVLWWGGWLACAPVDTQKEQATQDASSTTEIRIVDQPTPDVPLSTDKTSDTPTQDQPTTDTNTPAPENPKVETPPTDTATTDTTAPETAPDIEPDTALDVAPDVTPEPPQERQPAERSVPDLPAKEAPPEPTRPACISATGKDLCDDGDDCNGRERCNKTTGKCIKPAKPACPTAPAECNQTGGSTKPKANSTTPATPIAGFRLRDANKWRSYETIVDKIVLHSSVKKVSVNDVLGQLNRIATKVSSVSGLSCLARGFKWNAGDTAVKYWYPQGLTGSGTANTSGLISGRRILLASWYHKPQNDSSTSTNKGARVSFVDITSTNNIRYRHALLVEPVMVGTQASYRPVPIHAGGLVWVKNYLYVPDTSKGFRVFDLTRIIQVQSSDKNKVGYSTSTKNYQGFGYRYMIPQVNTYSRCPGSCCVRFSFASLSRAQTPASLLSGEYTSSDQRGRLHRWPLNPTTGRLVASSHGTVQATEVLFGGIRKMQGAAVVGSNIWISSSQPKSSKPTSPGSLGQATRNKTLKLYRYPYPPEDMHYIPQTKELWSHNEFPNNRYVFAIKTANRGTSCP